MNVTSKSDVFFQPFDLVIFGLEFGETCVLQLCILTYLMLRGRKYI